jgi:hypothetical protein
MKRKLITELDRDMIIAHIKRLELSKVYTVEVKQKRTVRTLPQNKLYWLWLTCIEAETGNNRMDLHDYFKQVYILPTEVNIFGNTVERRSTSGLDTAQFKQYLDKIQIFASTELSITLPDPEDLRWQEFYDYYSDRL